MNLTPKRNSGILLASLIAMMAGMGASVGGFKMPAMRTPPRVRNYPRMAVSPVAEIIAHNSAVQTRQVLRRQNMPRIKALRRDESVKAAHRHALKQSLLGRFST